MRFPDPRDVPAVAPKAAPQEDYGFADMSLEELRELWNTETAPKPDAGECVCPVFEDGVRGFRQRCPVHGGRSREDFARLSALRVELHSRVGAPASVKNWTGGKK